MASVGYGFCVGAFLGCAIVGPAASLLFIQMHSGTWAPFELPLVEPRPRKHASTSRRLQQLEAAAPSPPPKFEGLPAATRAGDFYQMSLHAGAWRGAWRESDAAGKGTIYYRYYPYFCQHLRRLRNMQMLEIGLDRGGSLNLWKEYFPHARIYGTDVENKTMFADPRTRIFQAEQTDTAALQRMLDAVPPPEPRALERFHLIVDDASHYPSDTIASFEYLFVHGLMPGGVYTLEDLSTSYDQFYKHRYGLYRHPMAHWDSVGRLRDLSVVNYFKAIGDLVNRRWERPPRGHMAWTHTYANADGEREPSTDVAEWVSTVTIAQSIIIVVKKTHDEYRLWPNACTKGDKKSRHGVCLD